MQRLLTSSLCALLVAGCPPEEELSNGGLPAPICNESARFVAGAPAFRDATSDFDLEKVGAEGGRISAVDLDGDGWPDLIVRRGGFAGDDLAAGERHCSPPASPTTASGGRSRWWPWAT